jgi:hypothetical protein
MVKGSYLAVPGKAVKGGRRTTREKVGNRIGKLAREYHETHHPEVREERFTG